MNNIKYLLIDIY